MTKKVLEDVPGARADHEISRFISKRHAERLSAEGERRAEQAYLASPRTREAADRETIRQEWISYCNTQANLAYGRARYWLEKKRRYEALGSQRLRTGPSSNGHDGPEVA